MTRYDAATVAAAAISVRFCVCEYLFKLFGFGHSINVKQGFEACEFYAFVFFKQKIQHR